MQTKQEGQGKIRIIFSDKEGVGSMFILRFLTLQAPQSVLSRGRKLCRGSKEPSEGRRERQTRLIRLGARGAGAGGPTIV